MGKRYGLFFGLLGVYFIYACTSIFTKMASTQRVLSWPFLFWIAGAVVVLGLFALLWQQILKRMPLSTAYMFKGISLVFVLLFSALLFGESVSWTNIAGSIIIIVGIVLFAKA